MNVAIVSHQFPGLTVLPSSAQVDTPTEVGPGRPLVPASLRRLRHGVGLGDSVAVGDNDDIVRVVFVGQLPESSLYSEVYNTVWNLRRRILHYSGPLC